MASMESDAVMVTHLFPPERASLVELLASLGADQRIGKDAALAAVSISGDRALGGRVLDAVAIIG